MFVKYENSLKEILNQYQKTANRSMAMLNISKEKRMEIDYLAAKNLIEITPYVMDDFNCRIKITDKGLTYFEEKRDKILRFWLPIFISIISLIGAYRQELAFLLSTIAK